MLHNALGHMQVIINALDIYQLTAEDSGQRVFHRIRDAFRSRMEKQLPKAMERAILPRNAGVAIARA